MAHLWRSLGKADNLIKLFFPTLLPLRHFCKEIGTRHQFSRDTTLPSNHTTWRQADEEDRAGAPGEGGEDPVVDLEAHSGEAPGDGEEERLEVTEGVEGVEVAEETGACPGAGEVRVEAEGSRAAVTASLAGRASTPAGWRTAKRMWQALSR